MCGRYTLRTPAADVAALLGLPGAPPLEARYNIAPTQTVPVVRQRHADRPREWGGLRWGLVPWWASGPEVGARMINARSETAAQKSAFKEPFRRRRCLVPADGFYEWIRVDRRRHPYYICMTDGSPFAFAGLWDRWRAPDGERLESFSILTTEPNAVTRRVHDRMPAILTPGDYDLWLDPAEQRPEVVQRVLRPYPAEEMTAYLVDTVVNRPENDDPRCLRRVG